MKAKEKAKELVNRFWEKITYKLGESTSVERAKQCALICVDEIQKQCLSFDYALAITQTDFLEEVKKEIKKL